MRRQTVLSMGEFSNHCVLQLFEGQMWFPSAQFPAVREQTSIASCLPCLVEERCQEPGTSFSGVPLLFRFSQRNGRAPHCFCFHVPQQYCPTHIPTFSRCDAGSGSEASVICPCRIQMRTRRRTNLQLFALFSFPGSFQGQLAKSPGMRFRDNYYTV